MKFSENWLRSHVKVTASRDELSAVLTAIGLEVEDVTAMGQGLDQAGQGQDALWNGTAQAACSESFCSSGASVRAMTAPPRHSSPW